MKTLKIFTLLLFLTVFSGCLKEEKLKQDYKGFVPLDINDGWAISNPEAELMDAAALEQVYRDMYADDELWMTKCLVVFRNKKLVAESYLKDDGDRTRIDAIWSCTKQVTGIITGIAIDEGYISSVDQTISDYLPEYTAKYPDKAGIKIENLLMMSGGFDFDNGYQSDVFRTYRTDNSLDYVLGLDLQFPQGTDMWYNDGEPQIISGIIQAATGRTMGDYGKEKLFDKIGFTNYEWKTYKDGLTMGPFGIMTSPRELAKIAQCVMDSGRWNGNQVIPLNWVMEMTSAKKTWDDLHSFGYYWWSIPSKHYIHMWGHGGQYAFIIPEKDMLVVITSLPQVDDDVNVKFEKILNIVDRVVATAE